MLTEMTFSSCLLIIGGAIETENIVDNACFAAGGPPPFLSNQVGSSNDECVCAGPGLDFFQYYTSISSQSFTDNLLPESRSMVPLWRYQTRETMDAGSKPSTV